MGKNALNVKRKKLSKALRKKEAAKQGLVNLSTEDLLSKAQEYIDTFQYEDAQKYCQEALKRDPDYVPALETSANLCLETGNLEGAKHCLGRAITLEPKGGYSKYLSMAQLMDGKDSYQCYLKGIELLSVLVEAAQKAEDERVLESKKMDANGTLETDTDIQEGQQQAPGGSTSSSAPTPDSSDSKENRAALIRKISTAFCSIGELFMTDLCDEEDAEDHCCTNIKKAQEADPTNAEAFQLMASYFLVKQQPEEAKCYIKQSVDLWLPKYKELHENKSEENTVDPTEVCPLSYATRLSAARTLIEVEEHDLAMEVLEGLSEEDDEVVDTWYLLGWSSYLQGEEHKDDARHYFHRAKQVHDVEPTEDEQMVKHLEELLEELGPLPDDEDNQEAVDEEDFLNELQQESDEEEMDTT